MRNMTNGDHELRARIYIGEIRKKLYPRFHSPLTFLTENIFCRSTY